MFIEMDQKLTEDVLNYLALQPYFKVVDLISRIQTCKRVVDIKPVDVPVDNGKPIESPNA